MVCLSSVGYGVLLTFQALALRRSRLVRLVCSDEGLTLETSAKHHIPQATNIPYQPLLVKPIFSVLADANFFKTCLPVFIRKCSQL